ncbi:MAG: HDOD domain-containing protein, partial [Planctomycetota bacterium]
DPDRKKIEEWIRCDLSLTYKLLRFINSAHFGLRHKVEKISQAITLMGQRNIRKWVSLAALTGLASDKPPALLVTSLVRARFCELMGSLFSLKEREDDLFLMGMLSTIDAILDVPMDKAIAEIPLPEDLRAALLGEPCHLARVLNIAIGYEAGDWALFEESTKGYDVDEYAIPPLHLQAVGMADEILRGQIP